MLIGVPKEIKILEGRVAIVPGGVQALVADGHDVVVQKTAGLGSGISDEDFTKAGAKILDTAEEVWNSAEMIVKVKEPMPPEYGFCRSDLTVFTYFHYAADKVLTDAMVEGGAACFTYETLEVDGSLPLLVPMSEVAGRMSVQVGSHCLEHMNGGRGILLGGVPGTNPANVVVLGGGVCGINAAKMAAGMGANVTIMDIDLERLRYLDDVMPANCDTLFSNAESIQTQLKTADLAIGAVLVEGARAPVLVPRSYLKLMKPKSVIVDIAVDQGGCFETTKATTHDAPTYVVDGILHYGVANMPGAVPHTSTYALTNATLPWVRKLAKMGAEEAVRSDAALRTALNTWKGKITYAAVAEYFGYEYTPADALV